MMYRYSMDTAKLAEALKHAKTSLTKHQFNAGWGSRLICNNYSWKAISYIAMAGIRKLFKFGHESEKSPENGPIRKNNGWISGYSTTTTKGSDSSEGNNSSIIRRIQSPFPKLLNDRNNRYKDVYTLCQDIVSQIYLI